MNWKSDSQQNELLQSTTEEELSSLFHSPALSGTCTRGKCASGDLLSKSSVGDAPQKPLGSRMVMSATQEREIPLIASYFWGTAHAQTRRSVYPAVFG